MGLVCASRRLANARRSADGPDSFARAVDNNRRTSLHGCGRHRIIALQRYRPFLVLSFSPAQLVITLITVGVDIRFVHQQRIGMTSREWKRQALHSCTTFIPGACTGTARGIKHRHD